MVDPECGPLGVYPVMSITLSRRDLLRSSRLHVLDVESLRTPAANWAPTIPAYCMLDTSEHVLRVMHGP